MNTDNIAVFSTFARNLPTMFLSVISRAAAGVAAAARWLGDTMDAYSINTINGKNEIGSIDDLAASAPRNVPNQHPARRYNGVGAGIVALAAALYASTAPAAPIQWGSEGPGVVPIGSTSMSGAQLVYLGTVVNHGNSDADNIVSVTVSTQNGSAFNFDQVFFNGDAYTPVSTTSSSATFMYPVPANAGPDSQYNFKIVMQAGQNPGYLTITAMSQGGTPFNMFDDSGEYDPINGTLQPLVVIPEPGRVTLIGTGLLALLFGRGRKLT